MKIYQRKERLCHILRSRGDINLKLSLVNPAEKKNLTSDVIFKFLLITAKMVSGL